MSMKIRSALQDPKALCRLDIMARGDKFQKRIFEYIAFQLVESQRLVVNDYASYVHIPGIISVTQ